MAIQEMYFMVPTEAPFDVIENPDEGFVDYNAALKESNRRKAIWNQTLTTGLFTLATEENIIRVQGMYFEGCILIAKFGAFDVENGIVAQLESGEPLVYEKLNPETIWLSTYYNVEDMEATCCYPQAFKWIGEAHMGWLVQTVQALRNGLPIPTQKQKWYANMDVPQFTNWPFWLAEVEAI